MGRLKILIGLGLATLPDMASGLLATHFLAPHRVGFYLAGVFFALLPDFDTLIHKACQGKVQGHKTGLHYPLPLILVSAGLTWVIYPIFVPATILALLLHFAHDSMGSSGGVKWFWPFSGKKFKISFHRGVYVSTEEDWSFEAWLEEFFLAWPPHSECLLGILYALEVGLLLLFVPRHYLMDIIFYALGIVIFISLFVKFVKELK